MYSWSLKIDFLRCMLVFCLLLLLPMKNRIIAQNNVPKVSCMYCFGTGRAGYVFCPFCEGSGLMTDPQYLNKQAYEFGRNLAKQTNLCITGKMNLINGDYSAAVDAFMEALDLKNTEAAFFLGACCELGMGLKTNKKLAKDFYSYGAKYGNIDSQQALNRINQYGYWAATEDMRQKFRKLLKMQIEIQSRATIMNYNNSNGSNNNSSYGSSGGYNCSSCRGTGDCTSCKGTGKVMYDIGQYVGETINTIKDCPVCKGSGKCGVCYGRGKIR